jgi:hypothetical protein
MDRVTARRHSLGEKCDECRHRSNHDGIVQPGELIDDGHRRTG